MSDAFDDLKTAIAAGNAVIVAGTGVSVAAMANAEPLVTWKGLLLDGLRACKPGKVITALIETLNDQPSLEDFLDAATKVETALSKEKRTNWLNDRLGNLEAAQPELIEAIGALGAPILTTNYDTLIARTLGRDAVNWTNEAQLGEVARGDADHILHLHGLYTEAESVVLGWASYTKVTDHKPSTLLKQGIGLMKRFVFIGCGVDGLTDPDLGPFFATYTSLFGGGRHFRICHESEAAATPHGIIPVTYKDHAELPGLLRALAPTKAAAPIQPVVHLEKPPEHFVGRDAQRELLVNRLLNAQPTLVTGPAGMGKSALCLAALHDDSVKAKYAGRRWFIRLDGATTAATMMGKVGEALGLPLDQRKSDNVCHALAQSPGILVLDNFETPWHGDEKAAEAELTQLRGIDGLALVVGVRGDDRLPAPCPPWLEMGVGQLGDGDALDLFQAWTNRAFDGDTDQKVLVAETGGWPMALVLLAREAAGLPRLARLLERWRTARAKAHDEIGTAAEVSLGSPRMTGDAHILATLLGRLPDGVAVEDLDIILPDRGEEAGAILVSIGLAQWSDGRNRLLTLAPIRQHLDKAHPPEEDHWTPCRDHYLGLAAAAAKKVDGAVFARLSPEASNVADVIKRVLDDPTGAKRALAAILGFGELFRFTGQGEGAALLRRVAGAGLGDEVTALCTLRLGMIAADRNEAGAESLLSQARDSFARIGDQIGEAECLSYLGDLARGQNRWAEAEDFYTRAEKGLGRRSPLGTAHCRLDRAVLALRQGKVAAALPLFRNALARFRRLDDTLGQGNCLTYLTQCAWHQNKPAQAQNYLAQALPLFRTAGDILGEANCHNLTAEMELAAGRGKDALSATALALPLYEQIGDNLGQGNCWWRRGGCAVAEGDTVTARAHFTTALGFFERIPKSMAMVKEDMAAIATGKERKRLFTQARAVYGELGLEDSVRRIDARFPDLAPKE